MSINIKIIGDRELNLYLGKLDKKVDIVAISGLDKIGDHLKDKVKDKFGKYHSSWPKLKRASVITKYRRRALQGMPIGTRKLGNIIIGPDDPLVLFGRLKDSIEKDLNVAAKEVEIYSDTPYSAVHEYGYAPNNIPARSYMRTTLYEETNEIIDIMDNEIGKII